jgi:hypothetical protein
MRVFKERADIFFSIALKSIALIVFQLMLINLTSAAKAPGKAGLITKFPFKMMDGGIVILQASIGDFPDTLNFVLDTGCGGVSLDSTTVEDLKLTPISSSITIKGIAQSKPARFVYNQTFHLPDLSIDSFAYHVNDYTFLREAYGIKVDGVLGYSFLKNFIVKVDYDKQMIEVWKPGNIKYPKAGSIMPLSKEKLPLFNAHVKDSTSIASSYIFDTGADLCLLMSDNFVEDNNILSSNKKVIEVQAEGLGGEQMMKFTAIPQMRVGQYTFENVPSFIFKDTYNVTKYPASGGVVGNNLLSRFNLIINYPDAQIHLLPNTYFSKPFDYSYTGFRIVNVDGKAIINSIAKNSPAEKAGLQEGDIVFGINNSFSDKFADYKEALFAARDKLKISIFRNNQIKTIVVAIESIL